MAMTNVQVDVTNFRSEQWQASPETHIVEQLLIQMLANIFILS